MLFCNCRVPICTLMSLLFGYIWLFVLQTSEALPAFYTFAVCAVAVSCVIELSSLVVQLVASAFLFVRLRVRKSLFFIHKNRYLSPGRSTCL